MTERVTELWDRPPVRWAFSMVAAAVLVVGAVLFWNAAHLARRGGDHRAALAARVFGRQSRPSCTASRSRCRPGQEHGAAVRPRTASCARTRPPPGTWCRPRCAAARPASSGTPARCRCRSTRPRSFAGAGYQALMLRARLIELDVTLGEHQARHRPQPRRADPVEARRRAGGHPLGDRVRRRAGRWTAHSGRAVTESLALSMSIRLSS